MVNLGNMMKQAQELQKKMAEAQNKLNEIEVEGTSGGGLVKVIATAKGSFKTMSIDESLIKIEEKEILEDLIIAAINDAKQNIKSQPDDLKKSDKVSDNKNVSKNESDKKLN